MSMTYIILPEEGFQFYEEALKNVSIDRDEWAELIVNKEIIQKFLKKKLFDYQIALARGRMRGKEDKVYYASEVIDDLIKSIGELENAIGVYEQKEEKK